MYLEAIHPFIKSGPASSWVAVGIWWLWGACLCLQVTTWGTGHCLWALRWSWCGSAQVWDTIFWCLQSTWLFGPVLGLSLLLASCFARHYWECSEQLGLFWELHLIFCYFSFLFHSAQRLVSSLLSSPWQVAWLIPIGFRRSKSLPSCASCFTQSCLYFPL